LQKTALSGWLILRKPFCCNAGTVAVRLHGNRLPGSVHPAGSNAGVRVLMAANPSPLFHGVLTKAG